MLLSAADPNLVNAVSTIGNSTKENALGVLTASIGQIGLLFVISVVFLICFQLIRNKVLK